MKRVISTAMLLLFINISIALSSRGQLQAQVQLSDSAHISLLTVSPWTGAVYALYGHTVLRVEDDSTGIDLCFNYGYFDPTKPHFIYRFIRGETDYILGVTSYEDFLTENKIKGLEVVEQKLNLLPAQKQQLWEELYVNALPENREYRYNFLFDNCATRPRDMVENIIDAPIEYPTTQWGQTFRSLIHDCVNDFSWMKFGIDLVIGADADKEITERQKMFLPYYLMNAFEGAKVQRNDTITPQLVTETNTVLKADSDNVGHSELAILSPTAVSFALLLLTLAITFVQVAFRRHQIARIYDTILFAMAGIAGSIVTFLVFFSQHPVVSPNWNLAWLHIVHLLFAGLFWVNSLKKVVYSYHFINFALLSLYLLGWWFIPQQMPLASIPLAMSLWLRSGATFYVERNNYLKNRQYKTAKYMQAGWKR